MPRNKQEIKNIVDSIKVKFQQDFPDVDFEEARLADWVKASVRTRLNSWIDQRLSHLPAQDLITVQQFLEKPWSDAKQEEKKLGRPRQYEPQTYKK